MKRLPLVSFCLFTFNQEKYISEAIDGALNQDYKNLEIIISDDCSTDNTWSIIQEKCAEYNGKHKLILNRNETNLGLAAHTNKLYYELSHGKYIAIGAGDDISLPSRISKSVEFLERNHDVVALSTSMNVIDSKGEIFRENERWIRDNNIFTIDDYLKDDFEHISGASRIISKKIIEYFPPLTLNSPTEDATFLFRAFLIGKVAEIDYVGVNYRVHGKNVSASINTQISTIDNIIDQHKYDLKFHLSKNNSSKLKMERFNSKFYKDRLKRLNKRKHHNRKRLNKINQVKTKLKSILNNDYLNIYSHPRSGTHFLEAFLAKNFYQQRDLSIDKITWGHWSNRKVNLNGNPYGKLFGHHFFPTIKNFKAPGIYIIRDGRAVAYSIWKTPNFLHKDIDETISFSDFLKTPLDWSGSPSKKTEEKLTIFEHWAKHCDEWVKFSEHRKDLLVIHYEDLVAKPYETYLKIKRFNFKFKRKLPQNKLNPIQQPTGLLPNKAKVNSWIGKYTNEELKCFEKIINSYDTLRKRY